MTYQDSFQEHHRILTLKFFVVRKPVNELHDQRLIQLSCYLKRVKANGISRINIFLCYFAIQNI